MANITFHQQVVHVTHAYLGPAADRFVARQISNHLGKKPEQLARRDLPELIDWIRLAMGFLTQDRAMIDDYIQQLESLYELPTAKKKLAPKATRS